MNMQGMTERNLRGVDLNLLVVFDALMAERNVTRAAQHNGLSQPAMSKALNRLRYLLDDRLFDVATAAWSRPRALSNSRGRSTGRWPIYPAPSRCTAPSIPDFRGRLGSLRSICINRVSCRPSARACGATRHVSICISRSPIATGSTTNSRGEVDLAIATILAGSAGSLAEPLWKDRLVTLLGAHNRCRNQ